jgi:hypothetical protein
MKVFYVMERNGTTFDSSVGQVTKSPNVAPIFPMIRCAKSRLSIVQGIVCFFEAIYSYRKRL